MAVRDLTPDWKLFTADVSGIGSRALNQAKDLQKILTRVLAAEGLELTRWLQHQFAPQGVSLLGFGAYGRIALHTWPEYGRATLDLWTCTPRGRQVLAACATGIAQRRSRRSAQAPLLLTTGDQN